MWSLLGCALTFNPLHQLALAGMCVCLCVCVCVLRTFKIYSPSNFQIYSTGLLTIVTIITICIYELEVFFFVVLFYFWIPHISEFIWYFSLTFFTWHNTLQVQPCCCKWQDFIIFLWLSDIPLHIYTTSSLSLHLSLLHLGCFYILAIVDIPAMNMEVNIYFQIRIFIYLICTQEWNC